MEDEREEEYIPHKWGECAICKKRSILQSVIGRNKCEFWAGWICPKCYEKARNEDVK